MATRSSSGVPAKAYRHARTDALLGLAALSSLVFIWLIAVPVFAEPKLATHDGHRAVTITHIFGGAIMLLAGAAALRIGLTRTWFRWHRPVGFTYLAAGSIASVTALVRSFDTAHTPGLSTGTLAAVWLAFSAMAWRAIRNRRFDQHREWMIRSYVVAWTFVFCRFYTRAMPSAFQGGETDMIWMTWIVPVLMCEIALQWRRGAAPSAAG